MNDPAVCASSPVPEDVTGSASCDADQAGSRTVIDPGKGVAAAPGDLERLVAEHGLQITRLVRRLLGWPNDVDDVVQDVFVAALKGLSRFDRRSTLATWLARIAINCCRSHQRRAMLRRWLPLHAVRESPAATKNSTISLIDQETSKQVREAIRQLPTRDREVIVLRYLEELPIDEIARLCGASTGAVEVRLSRARRKLEMILQPLMKS